MQFDRPKPRRPADTIVPMINVVFLLLIFFLMSAQLTPPAPFDVSPPTATADSAPAPGTPLFAGPDGALAYDGLRGDAVWPRLAERGTGTPLVLRADAALPADAAARLLSRLGAAGQPQVQIVTVQP